MTIIDPAKISEILVEAAGKHILPRYKMLEDHEIDTKSGPNDLVTQADIDVEEYLTRLLPDFLPGSAVIGEESASKDPSILDILHDKSQAVWIVDPIDGTHNFVHHKREFGVMLACIIDGQTQYGWIYDVLGEATAVAEKGNGAFLEDDRLQVTPLDTAEQLSGHINPRYFPRKYQDTIQQAREAFKECKSLHCAAHEYLNIAKGKAHFSVYSRMKPWDHLAGSLIVQESGGFVAKWDNSPYIPADNHVGLIAAASQDNWQITFDHFLKKYMEDSDFK